jgi:hypothetical protein
VISRKLAPKRTLSKRQIAKIDIIGIEIVEIKITEVIARGCMNNPLYDNEFFFVPELYTAKRHYS